MQMQLTGSEVDSSTELWGHSAMAADGTFLLGISIIVTILGTQLYYKFRGQPVNNSVAGLVMGMATGAIVFNGSVPHRAIKIDSQVFYNLLIPPIVFYAGFSVKKKLFFKNLVTITIFGILGCNLTAYLLSAGIYPILQSARIYDLPAPHYHQNTSALPPSSPNPLLARPFTPVQESGELHIVKDTQHSESGHERAFQSRLSHGFWRSATPPYPQSNRRLQAPLDGHSGAIWDASSQSTDSTVARAAVADEIDTKNESDHRLLSAAMRLGTVFSPTDNLAILHYLSPNTQPVLHSLLFGEGVMNDITAIIMLRTTAAIPALTWKEVAWSYWDFSTLFLSSSVMGVSAGLLSALLTKYFFSEAHHHTDREVILMTTMAATSYVGAVLAGLSGTLAVFFCGITMSHYTWHSISASARVMSVHNFRVLCSLSEVFLFIYAGLDTSAKLTARLGNPEDAPFMHAVLKLALALVFLVAVVRALFVALAVAIVNLWRSYKFTLREAVIMWYGGLVRGSVTTALAYSYLYTEARNTPGDEAVLLASVLVVVVSTVLVGGLSQEFMACVTLPPAQSRLIEINMLPGMNHEDDTSVNSAAVLSSKLHKLWRRFDKAVLQRLFGGRDARMPNYFQSVAELNQRIMRVQDANGSVAMSPMVGARGHTMPHNGYAAVLPSASSTDLSTVHPSDFQGDSYQPSEDGLERDGGTNAFLCGSGTPSPRPSSNSQTDVADILLRAAPANVSSDLVSNPALSANSSLSNCNAPLEVTELPTTTSVIQQMEGVRPIPRSHSDPHVNHANAHVVRNTSGNSREKKSPTGGAGGAGGGTRRLLHCKTMIEPRTLQQRAQMRPATPPIEGGEHTAGAPPVDTAAGHGVATGGPAAADDIKTQAVSGLSSDGVQSTQHDSQTSISPMLAHAVAAVAADSPKLPVSTDGAGLSTGAHEYQDRVAQALRDGFLGAAGAIAASGQGGAGGMEPEAGEQWAERGGGLGDKPPVGPSAAAARQIGGHSNAHRRVGSGRSDGVTSQSSDRATPPAQQSMMRQGSRGLAGEPMMVTAQSMHADNLPEPYQPPASNATSEDVHIGLENQYSSYEDALLDVKHGGEDVDIPWDAYDEEDKKAAAGSRSAMSQSYKRH